MDKVINFLKESSNAVRLDELVKLSKLRGIKNLEEIIKLGEANGWLSLIEAEKDGDLIVMVNKDKLPININTVAELFKKNEIKLPIEELCRRFQEKGCNPERFKQFMDNVLELIKDNKLEEEYLFIYNPNNKSRSGIKHRKEYLSS